MDRDDSADERYWYVLESLASFEAHRSGSDPRIGRESVMESKWTRTTGGKYGTTRTTNEREDGTKVNAEWGTRTRWWRYTTKFTSFSRVMES